MLRSKLPDLGISLEAAPRIPALAGLINAISLPAASP
jgi:hypothetical protein